MRSSLSALCFTSALPTPVEPVNVSLRSRPSSISAVVTSPGLVVGSTDSTPLGRPGLVHQLGQQQHRQRRLLRRLDDHRAAGRHRGADLAGAHRQREVPRRDRVARPDGLLGDDDAAGARRARGVAAVDAHRLLGEPAEELGAVLHLAHALGEHLAHFQGHQRGEVLGAFGDRLEHRAQDLAALAGRGGRPLGLHAARRRRVRRCASVGGGVGDGDQHLVGRTGRGRRRSTSPARSSPPIHSPVGTDDNSVCRCPYLHHLHLRSARRTRVERMTDIADISDYSRLERAAPATTIRSAKSTCASSSTRIPSAAAS